jgi:hypothetical protein
MDAWITIGSRYINLQNVCEVRFDDHLHAAFVFYIGGGSIELRDDDASDLRAYLVQRALIPESPHRTVFAPSSG